MEPRHCASHGGLGFSLGVIRDQLIKAWPALFAEGGAAVAAPENGNGHHPEQKAVVLSVSTGIQFHSPDGKIIHRFSGGMTSDVEQVSRETAYAASAYCFAAVRFRARKVAEAPLMVVREDPEDGSKEWLPRHVLAEILDAPSPDYDMGELLLRTQIYQDVTGSALWVKDADRRGRTGRLTPFAGSEFQIEQTADRIRGLFRVSTVAGEREYGPDDVVYFLEPSPYDWHRGVSLVDVALSWLNLGSQSRATVHDILQHALFPSVIVQTDKDWRPLPESDEWKQFKDELRAHARRPNKGDPLALTGGGTAKVVTPRLKDLIPGDILNRVESVVSSVFGVPAVVLQFEVGMQNSPWSQMEEARRMVEQDTIQPLRRDIEKRLTRQILRDVDDDPSTLVRFDLSEVRALQPDLKMLSNIQNKQKDIASVNERRAIVGLEPSPLPEHDEIPKKPEPPVGPVGATPKPGGQAPPDDEDEEGKSYRYIPATPDASLLWLEFDLSTKAAARVWEPEVAALLAKQSTDILKLFRKFVRESDGSVDEDTVIRFLNEVGQYMSLEGAAAAKAVLMPLVESSVLAAGQRMSARLGFSFDLVQEGIERYIAEETDFLVRVMGETTGKAVAGTVQAALEERVPLTDLRKRLEALPEFDRTRAQLVARTETTRASNGAQRRAASEYQSATGTRVQKTWISSRDVRVREEHDEQDDGEWYGVDETFPVVGLTEPGEPNCRCTLGYRVAREGQ